MPRWHWRYRRGRRGRPLCPLFLYMVTCVREFVPRPMLDERSVVLSFPELEALRLVDVEGLSHEAADISSKPMYMGENETIYDKFAKGVLMLAETIGGKVIGYSKSGNTAMRISRYRPITPSYIVVSNVKSGQKDKYQV